MKIKKILITGGFGFIGFNAVQLWKRMYPDIEYVILDSETYAAQYCLDEKKVWCKTNDIQWTKTDIRDLDALRHVMQLYPNIDAIVNFAAESHVDNSISDPSIFFDVNVNGCANLLELAKEYKLRFHQVSTDEVYGETTPDYWDDLEMAGVMSLLDVPLKPSSPYAASKAAADLTVLSYVRTYGINATITRCTNNAGPYQHPEKLIGTVITHAFKNNNIPVYGKGHQRRHWISVNDHNTAIMNVLQHGEAGMIYNVSAPAKNWITNMKLVKTILKHMNVQSSLISHVSDRPGHDTSYYLPPVDGLCHSNTSYTKFLPETVKWYLERLENEKS